MAAVVSSHISHIGGSAGIGGDASGIETDDDMPGLESVDSSEVSYRDSMLATILLIALLCNFSVFREHGGRRR